ncbi:MAG: hypothetical protein KA436_10580 [Oligoflexales bacterium]|nr:hypothetical protein [Oligoflexales bacterium]
MVVEEEADLAWSKEEKAETGEKELTETKEVMVAKAEEDITVGTVAVQKEKAEREEKEWEAGTDNLVGMEVVEETVENHPTVNVTKEASN